MKLVTAAIAALLLVALAATLGAMFGSFGARVTTEQVAQNTPDAQTQPCRCPHQKHSVKGKHDKQ